MLQFASPRTCGRAASSPTERREVDSGHPSRFRGRCRRPRHRPSVSVRMPAGRSPPPLRRSTDDIQLATEIWGEDTTKHPDVAAGPDFSAMGHDVLNQGIAGKLAQAHVYTPPPYNAGVPSIAQKSPSQPVVAPPASHVAPSGSQPAVRRVVVRRLPAVRRAIIAVDAARAQQPSAGEVAQDAARRARRARHARWSARRRVSLSPFARLRRRPRAQRWCSKQEPPDRSSRSAESLSARARRSRPISRRASTRSRFATMATARGTVRSRCATASASRSISRSKRASSPSRKSRRPLTRSRRMRSTY